MHDLAFAGGFVPLAARASASPKRWLVPSPRMLAAPICNASRRANVEWFQIGFVAMVQTLVWS